MIVNIKTLLVFISALCLAESVSFQCNFETLVLFDEPAYTCTAIVEPTDDESILSDVQGVHGDGLSNVDVLALDVSSETLRVLPRNLATFFPNLESISVINSTLATITAEDLQLLSELKFLRASMNNIVSLDGNLFQYNPRLTIIDFSSNWIEIIGQNLLTQLSELVIVDFSNNRCIDIYADTPETILVLNVQMPIRCSDNTDIVFICTFTDSIYGWVSENIYTCNAEVFGTDNELTNVIGDHLEGRSNIDVRGLDIQNQVFEQVSKNIASFFPDLLVLVIFDSNLLTISAVDLEPFPNLQFFGAQRNDLALIDGDLFRHNPLLKYVDFNNNAIDIVGLNLLQDLTSLEAIDFRNNRCINMYANSSETFQALNVQMPIRCSDNPDNVVICTFTDSIYTGWISDLIYTCNAELFGSDNEVTDVIGDHLEGRSIADVRGFDIQNELFLQLTKNIASFFPDLLVLSIFNTNLTRISAADLEPFPNLIFFRAQRNRLVTIDGDLFKHNPMLIYIDFDGNLITTVGEDLLKDLAFIEGVDFHRNRCVNFLAFSPETFEELNNILATNCTGIPSDVFHCDFTDSTFEWVDNDIYTCNAEVLGRRYVLIGVTGDHLDDRRNADVRGLEIHNQDYIKITVNITNFFPDLHVLIIFDCQLRTISAADLPFPNLQFFRVWRNHLTSISGDLFIHNPQLKYIDFDTNLIEIVGYDLLQDLTSLEAVDFSRNHCINRFAGTPEAIQELNDILPMRCPDKPGVVFDCSLTDTYWSWVDGSVYECDATVTQFGQETVLRNVFGNHLEGRSNVDVRGLHIQNQKYDQLTKNIVEYFPNLEVLSIQDCTLTTISAVDLQPFPKLVFFRVLGNFLEALDSDLYMYNPLLRHIDFHDNMITEVGENMMSDLTLLISADFSQNPCIDIYAGSQQAIQELEDVLRTQCPLFNGTYFECKFSNNNWISPNDYVCSANIVQIRQSITLLDVTGDHIEGKSHSDVTVLEIQDQVYDHLTRNIAAFFPNLEVLSIHGCTLRSISAADLQPFPKLKYFKVSGNTLTSIDSDLFMHNPLLRYIDFDDNWIEAVNLNLVEDLTMLETIDFRNNRCIDMYANSPESIHELNDILKITCSDDPGDVFHCNFIDTYWTYLTELTYTCDATVSHFGGEIALRNVFGVHMEGRSNLNVSGLVIQNQVYNQLSRNIELFFPDIEVLVIQNSSLLIISASDLQPFPNLVIFRVWMNKLEALEGDLFMYNLGLVYIDLDTNLIERVGLNIFEELIHLDTVDFSRNVCIHIFAESPMEVRELSEMLPDKCPWFDRD